MGNLTANDRKLKKCQFGMLRMIGVLGICIMHYEHLYIVGGFPDQMTGAHFLNYIARHGAKLTTLFFMLSGYGITLKYLSAIFEGYGTFLKQRVGSLVPAAIVSTLIMAVLCQTWFAVFGEWWTGRESTLYNIAGNLLGLQSFLPKQFMDTVNGPTWYIYSLMVCYIVFGIYQKKFASKPMTFWLICILLCIGGEVYQIDYPLFNATTFRSLLAFSLGCILAINTDSYLKSMRAWKWILGGVIIAFITFALRGGAVFGDFEMILLLTVYPFAIVVTALAQESNIFKNPYINQIERFMRKWSFYIYLYNLPSLIFFGMINKVFDFSFGELSILLTFLFMNLLIGIIASVVSGTKMFTNIKKKFICSCSNFFEEITW